MSAIFKRFITARIERKFEIALSLKITPHIKCVATLPCESNSWKQDDFCDNTF